MDLSLDFLHGLYTVLNTEIRDRMSSPTSFPVLCWTVEPADYV